MAPDSVQGLATSSSDKLMDELKTKGKMCQMSADPIEARDWIYVDDVVEAVTR